MFAFVSYARGDAEVAVLLAGDIERAGWSVWIDRQLTGGEAWWETVLSRIRDCSFFVFVLSPESLRSTVCMAELHYAIALERPLLPVMVRDTSPSLPPLEIANLQYLDYRERNADSALSLAHVLLSARAAPSLPTPLPPAPAIPARYAHVSREQVEAGFLAYDDQVSLVGELRRRVGGRRTP